MQTIGAPKRIMWIGLNPSTADEQKLDPTLRRIRAFSMGWGFTEFVMTNLFAYRSTDPRAMLRFSEPVGDRNDEVLLEQARNAQAVVVCWGSHGGHLLRDVVVSGLLWKNHIPLVCLGRTASDAPRHPLYVKASQNPIDYT